MTPQDEMRKLCEQYKNGSTASSHSAHRDATTFANYVLDRLGEQTKLTGEHIKNENAILRIIIDDVIAFGCLSVENVALYKSISPEKAGEE